LVRRRLIKLLDKLEEINKTRQSLGLGAAFGQALAAIREMLFYTTRTVLFFRPLDIPLDDVDVGQDVTLKEL